MRRRGRADILKLVLPLPLVALLMVAAYFGTRRSWERSPHLFWDAKPPTQDHTAGSRAPESAQEAPAVTRTEERHAQFALPAVPEPLPERADAAASPTPRRPPTGNDRLPGPALDKATPSYEAALRASEPPPAAASAPSPVPAPAVPLVPACDSTPATTTAEGCLQDSSRRG